MRVGESGSTGVLEITDMIFSTRGPAAGAIVVEWNIHSDEQGGAGMWDSHIRYVPTSFGLLCSVLITFFYLDSAVVSSLPYDRGTEK